MVMEKADSLEDPLQTAGLKKLGDTAKVDVKQNPNIGMQDYYISILAC